MKIGYIVEKGLLILMIENNTLQNTVFFFPAKGKLYEGVGLDYYDNYVEIREYFDAASELCKINFKKYLSSSKSDFNKPMDSEIATLLISVSKHYAWKKEIGVIPELYSGLSMGLFSALVASGAISIEDSIKLLAFTVEEGHALKGKMAMICGLSYEEISNVIKELKLDETVVISNCITRMQIAVSGDESSIDKFLDFITKNLICSCRVLYNAQFHTPLLFDSSKRMNKIMQKMNVKKPYRPVFFSNDLEKAFTEDDVIKLICKEHYSKVRLYDSVDHLYSKGINIFIEFGPKDMLAKTIRLINNKVQCHYVDEMKSISNIFDKLN